MLKTKTFYAIKRSGKYLAQYKNCMAELSPAVEDAFYFQDLQSANDIAGRIRGANVVEIMIIERALRW